MVHAGTMSIYERLRVFVSSSMDELADERKVVSRFARVGYSPCFASSVAALVSGGELLAYGFLKPYSVM